jgi:hypothetical protein
MLKVLLILDYGMVDKTNLISLDLPMRILPVIDLIEKVLVGYVNFLGDH